MKKIVSDQILLRKTNVSKLTPDLQSETCLFVRTAVLNKRTKTVILKEKRFKEMFKKNYPNNKPKKSQKIGLKNKVEHGNVY